MAPHLPRKATGVARSNDLLRAALFQIGTLVAIERHRKDWTQEELAAQVGLTQVDVSRIENGEAPAGGVTDAKIGALFTLLGLPQRQANFVKWWRRALG